MFFVDPGLCELLTKDNKYYPINRKDLTMLEKKISPCIQTS